MAKATFDFPSPTRSTISKRHWTASEVYAVISNVHISKSFFWMESIPPASNVIERTGSITAVSTTRLPATNFWRSFPMSMASSCAARLPIDRELMQKAPRLKVVGRAGVGVDNVDIDTATERGILVMNSPGGSTTTTAEHAIAMLFALARSIPQAYLSLKSGKVGKEQIQRSRDHGQDSGRCRPRPHRQRSGAEVSGDGNERSRIRSVHQSGYSALQRSSCWYRCRRFSNRRTSSRFMFR